MYSDTLDWKIISIFSIAKCKSLISQEKGSYLSINEKIIHVYENFHPDNPLFITCFLEFL